MEELRSWKHEGWDSVDQVLPVIDALGLIWNRDGITASLLFALLPCLLSFAKGNYHMFRDRVPISVSEPTTENSQGC